MDDSILDPEIIARPAKTRAHAEARQIQPANFKSGTALPVINLLDEYIRQTAGCVHGSRVAVETEYGFQPGRKFFGGHRALCKRSPHKPAGCCHCFLAHNRRRFARC